MSQTLDTAWVLRWAARTQEVIAQHRIELMELDRAIGDGDHGDNLDRGFTAVTARLADAAPDTPAAALKLIATNPVTADGKKTTPVVWDSNCLEEVCGSCTMNAFGKPWTCMPCNDVIPSDHFSDSRTPSRPTVSNPDRRANSVPTSNPDA